MGATALKAGSEQIRIRNLRLQVERRVIFGESSHHGKPSCARFGAGRYGGGPLYCQYHTLHDYVGPQIASSQLSNATIMPSDLDQTQLGRDVLRSASRYYRHLGIKNAIRPTAIGNRNWLFIGEAEAGNRSAILYTIVECCRRRGLDPAAYLRDILIRLPSSTNWQIKDLTPEAGAQPLQHLRRAA